MNMWWLRGLGGEVTGGCLGEMPSVEEWTGVRAVRCSVGGFALGCSNMDTWVGTGREIEQHLVFSGGRAVRDGQKERERLCECQGLPEDGKGCGESSEWSFPLIKLEVITQHLIEVTRPHVTRFLSLPISHCHSMHRSQHGAAVTAQSIKSPQDFLFSVLNLRNKM